MAKTTKTPKLKDGDHCTVIAGTHAGKSGTVTDINTSKTGHITITVVQKNGVRFKTLGKNVEIAKAGTAVTPKKSKKLAEIKTKENTASVEDYIKGLPSDEQRKDSLTLLKMMQKASKEKPKMWGASMIGFGKKIYTSPSSGRQVEWFFIGFSPRKANLSLHLVFDIKKYASHLKKLGKHKTGMGCLYINKLADVDLKVLEELIAVSLKSK